MLRRRTAVDALGGVANLYILSGQTPICGTKFLCITIKRAIVSRPFSFCPAGILTCPEDKDHGPNRWRYSLDAIKALTISALLKSPLNEFSLASQN